MRPQRLNNYRSIKVRMPATVWGVVFILFTSHAEGADRSAGARPTTQSYDSSDARQGKGAWGKAARYEEGYFELDKVPLEQAYAKLAERSGQYLAIEVEWDALAEFGLSRTTLVSVSIWTPKVSTALRAILNSAGGEKALAALTWFEAGNSRLCVTSLARHLSRDGVSREYSIRRFLIDVLPDPKPDGDPPKHGNRGPTRRERTESLAQLIRDNVDPESWKLETACFIRADGDRLIIRQVEESQKKIELLFDQLDEMRSPNVLAMRVRPTTQTAATRPAR